MARVGLVLVLQVVHTNSLGNGLPMGAEIRQKETVASTIAKVGTDAQSRLTPYFYSAGVEYPPNAVTLLAFKEEKILELWARSDQSFKKIRSYPILAASGKPGPKRREGDKQVPEGAYKVIALNPNSRFHLSMKLNYPNEFDQMHAQREGRYKPGSNIFIHGKAVSIGCLAIGDAAIEELFVLADRVGLANIDVLIAPHNPQTRPFKPGKEAPDWLSHLYYRLSHLLAEFN